MANYDSTLVDNFQLKTTKNAVTTMEGNLKMISATISVEAAYADNDVFFIAPVRSNWSIKHIWIYNDAITGGTSFDVGLYTTASTPVVVSATAYGSAIDLSSARTTAPLDAAFEARNITAVNQLVHTDGGVTTDPATWYYLAMKANTVGSAQGDITVIIEYVGD